MGCFQWGPPTPHRAQVRILVAKMPIAILTRPLFPAGRLNVWRAVNIIHSADDSPFVGACRGCATTYIARRAAPVGKHRPIRIARPLCGEPEPYGVFDRRTKYLVALEIKRCDRSTRNTTQTTRGGGPTPLIPLGPAEGAAQLCIIIRLSVRSPRRAGPAEPRFAGKQRRPRVEERA